VLTHLMSRVVQTGSVLAVGCSLLWGSVEAGCNCGGRGGSSSAGTYGPVAEPMLMGSDMYTGTVVDTQWVGGQPVYQLPMTPDVGPPPGTLGQTYQRPMKPIPVDKHPRISIIDVRAPGATKLKVYGTNEYRTKDGFIGFQDRKDHSSHLPRGRHVRGSHAGEIPAAGAGADRDAGFLVMEDGRASTLIIVGDTDIASPARAPDTLAGEA
jgi:hypothetical protein